MSKKFLSPIKLAQGASVPSAGSSGELFYNTTDSKIYTHNGTAWVASGGGVTNSATAPSSPANGDAWFNTTEGTLFIYYSDGTSGQWVESTPPVQNAEVALAAGSIMAWGGATAPANWLIADGSAISRTVYASLFAAIGTQYGVGDGLTTFNLPNLKGRVVVGKDSAQTEFDVLGETGGAKTHTLTVTEMPSHTHIQDSHNHTQDSHNHSQNSHYHQIITRSNVVMQHELNGGSSVHGTRYNSNMANELATASSTATNNATTATNQATTATNQNTGGGGAHNNLQPYIVLNYIIKFSAGETPGESQLATRVGILEVQNNATPLGPNYIINGAMDIWQRGTSGFTTNNAYCADRWRASIASSTISQATMPNGSVATYGMLFTTSSATNSNGIIQALESTHANSLRGKTVTLSFYAQTSIASQTLLADIQTSSTADSATTGFSVLKRETITTSTTLTRYTTSVAIPSDSSSAGIRVVLSSSNIPSGSTLLITGVQLEEGSNATPFRRNSPNIAAELLACQRYYYRIVPGTGGGNFTTGAAAISTTTIPFTVMMPSQFRRSPDSTVDWTGTAANYQIDLFGTGPSGKTITSFTYSNLSINSVVVVATGTGYTAGTMYFLQPTTATAHLGFNAEL